MYDSETHSEFIRLRGKGCTLTKTAEQLGISFATARNWDHQHYEEIRDRCHELKDLFVETFRPNIGKVLESLKAELERINAELEKRDYTKEPTWLLVNRQNMILSRFDKICANPPLLIVDDPDPTAGPSKLR